MDLERNLAEMARGKLVQQRAARWDQLQKSECAKQVIDWKKWAPA